MPAKKNISRKAQYQYFNRELSWLAFNRRVLDLSISGSQPLLERLKFLSIVSSNLDEFFEIRVAGLIQQVESGVVDVGLDGLGPRDQLEKIRECAGDLVDKQYACWLNQIVPEMKKQGIVFKTKSEITRIERRWLEAHFAEQIYPVLTPMAIDPAHPFPQLANRSMNILVSLEDPSTKDGDEMMAVRRWR